MLAVLLMTGCGLFSGPEIIIDWKSPKPGLEPQTPLRYESIVVGYVTKVDSHPDGATAIVRLQKKQARFVRTRSDFLFHPAGAGHPAFVELIVLDKESPPAADGARFQGSDLAAESAIKWLSTDWKRTAILLSIAVVILLVSVYIIRVALKLWGVIASLVAGAVCAAVFGSLAAQELAPLLPPGTRVDLVGYSAAFVGGVIASSFLVGVILKPLKRS
jgi:hypothetical protein